MTVPIHNHPPFGGAFSGAFEGAVSSKSGFIPTELTSLVLWLDATFGVTSAGVPLRVSSWLDRSGKGNDATQMTAGQQPFFEATGLNGFPSLRWSDPDEGGDDTMEIQDANSLDLTSDFTFFIVQEFEGVFPAGINMLAKNVDAGYRLLLDSMTRVQTKVSDGTLQTDTSLGQPNVGPLILEIHYEVGGKINYTANGVALGDVQENTLTAITANTAKLFIGSKDGSSDFWFGDIGEILLFDELLDLDSRNQVGNYLGSKYNLAWIDIKPNPDDIAGLVLWLDAKRGIQLNGSDVSNWADQSGNDNNAAQTLASKQPVFQATGLNSLPTLQFNESEDENMSIMNSSSLDLNSSFTFYVVVNSIALSADRYIISRNPNTGYEIFMDMSNSERLTVIIKDSVGIQTVVAPTPPTDSTDIILEVHYEIGGTVNFTQSGVPLGDPQTNTLDSIDQGTATFFVGSRDGTAFPFEGQMAQIVLFNRLLTLKERNEAGNSLATSYGLTWTEIVPFSPNALSGLVLWLDASVGKTLIDGRVSQWDDQSGEGNNAVQTNPFNRCRLDTFGPRSLDSLLFTISENTFMDVAADSSLDFTSSFSFFAVMEVVFEDGAIFDKNGTAGYQWFIGPGLNLEITASASTGGPQNLQGNQITPGESLILEVNFQVGGSNVVQFTQNGVSLGEQTNTLANINGTTDNLRIGNSPSLPLQGKIAQIIIYNKLLNTAERNLIGQYLADTYALSWTKIT